MNYIPTSPTTNDAANASRYEAATLNFEHLGAAVFADTARLASLICGVPAACITLGNGAHQTVEAHFGNLSAGCLAETAFARQIARGGLLSIIADTLNESAISEAKTALRFCAGIALSDADGLIVGTLCLFNHRALDLDPVRSAVLEVLARQVVTQLDQRHAVRRAHEDAEHWRLILESAVDFAIVTTDLTGRITSWNVGAHRVLGWSEAEVRGQLATLFFSEEDRADGVLEAEMATALRLGRGQDERWHVRRDGTRFWASGEMLPLRGADGTPRGFLKILRDRTLQHEAGLALERSLAQLRESEAQLRQTQKLEAIGRLAAGVAHDFNNILQSVSGGLELVLDEVAHGTAAHECAEIALGAARRGAYLTNHLLSYARKQMLQPQLLEIGPYLDDMQRLLARTLGPHIAVLVRTQPDGPPVHADPVQLQTALLNLAINASHAMPRGGTLFLQSRLEPNHDGQAFVVIAVTDTGAGMDAATLAQAFEPFFTTKGLDGTGLGLSMVQGFAEQSGGTTRIASTRGEGTSVELWLPAAEVRAATEVVRAQRNGLRGHGRILLVDDVIDVLTTVGALLERAGFDLVRANGAKQALGFLEAGERIDLVVSDFAMPGCDGVELIAQLRRIVPGLPAVVITGFAEVGSVDITVIRKPFERQELLEVVLGALGQ